MARRQNLVNLKGMLEPVAKEKEPSRTRNLLEVAGPHPAALLISFSKPGSKVKLERWIWVFNGFHPPRSKEWV